MRGVVPLVRIPICLLEILEYNSWGHGLIFHSRCGGNREEAHRGADTTCGHSIINTHCIIVCWGLFVAAQFLEIIFHLQCAFPHAPEIRGKTVQYTLTQGDMTKHQICRWMNHCTKMKMQLWILSRQMIYKHQIIRCDAPMNRLKMSAKNNDKLEALLKDLKGLSDQTLSWKNSQLIIIYVCIIRY